MDEWGILERWGDDLRKLSSREPIIHISANAKLDVKINSLQMKTHPQRCGAGEKITRHFQQNENA